MNGYSNWAAVTIAAALLMAACGSDDDEGLISTGGALTLDQTSITGSATTLVSQLQNWRSTAHVPGAQEGTFTQFFTGSGFAGSFTVGGRLANVGRTASSLSSGYDPYRELEIAMKRLQR